MAASSSLPRRTNLIAKLMHEQCGRCASCDHEVVLAAGAGIFMASLDKVGDRYDDSAQVLCLGCQRFFNDLDASARDTLVKAVVEASAAPLASPLASLPAKFERSVETKLRQMKQREEASDRPSRGAAVELSVAAGCRRLRRCGLRCTCAALLRSRVRRSDTTRGRPLRLTHHLPLPRAQSDQHPTERHNRGSFYVVV